MKWPLRNRRFLISFRTNFANGHTFFSTSRCWPLKPRLNYAAIDTICEVIGKQNSIEPRKVVVTNITEIDK